MKYDKYFSIIDESIKDIVYSLHPALQEDIANIIIDLQTKCTSRQINKEIMNYILDLPDELITSSQNTETYDLCM